MVPVSTGQGRNYLILVGGRSATGEALKDIWALQLPPEHMTAASIKDAARTAISKETREMDWEEVKYYDDDGTVIRPTNTERDVLVREGCAAARSTEVDGASIVLWGGVNQDGRVCGDGLMITVDR